VPVNLSINIQFLMLPDELLEARQQRIE